MNNKWDCKYIALDMYSGELVLLTTNKIHKVGEEVKSQWVIKEVKEEHIVHN